MVCNLKEMETSDIINLYSETIKELKKREVIRTKNVTGELGEYLAIKYYNDTPGLPNLEPAPIGTKVIDAISREGKRYSIKSTSSKTTGVFYGLEPKDSSVDDERIFEYVIICRFGDDFRLEEILEMDWNTFLETKKWHTTMKAWNLNLTQEVCQKCDVIYSRK